MNYKAHQIGGLSLGASAALLKYGIPKNPETALLSLVIIGTATTAALLPDIDEPSSKVGRKTAILSNGVKAIAGHRGFFHSPLAVVGLWIILELLRNASVVANGQLYITTVIVAALVIGVFMTRRKRVTIGFVLVAVWIVLGVMFDKRVDPGLILRCVEEGVLLGYISHLLMDMTNRAGIPLLYPFSKKKFHLMTLKTNRDEFIAETLFIIPVVAILFREWSKGWPLTGI